MAPLKRELSAQSAMGRMLQVPELRVLFACAQAACVCAVHGAGLAVEWRRVWQERMLMDREGSPTAEKTALPCAGTANTVKETTSARCPPSFLAQCGACVLLDVCHDHGMTL